MLPTLTLLESTTHRYDGENRPHDQEPSEEPDREHHQIRWRHSHIRANTAIRKTNDIASAAIPLPTVGRMHFFRASKTTVNMGMKPATPIPIPATRTPMSLESTIDRLSTAQS